jgi:hypothetical protein
MKCLTCFYFIYLADLVTKCVTNMGVSYIYEGVFVFVYISGGIGLEFRFPGHLVAEHLLEAGTGRNRRAVSFVVMF